MLKKDVLKILTTSEAGKAINKHASQVTRMPKSVPEEYQKSLLMACQKNLMKKQEIYSRISLAYNMRKKTIICNKCGKEAVRFHTATTCLKCSGKPTKNQARAISKVNQAVKKGRLPKLDGSVPCVDCGKPATDYDHRDYDKPLDVVPTCRSCNVLRFEGKNK